MSTAKNVLLRSEETGRMLDLLIEEWYTATRMRKRSGRDELGRGGEGRGGEGRGGEGRGGEGRGGEGGSNSHSTMQCSNQRRYSC